jgi:hypothetical protein
VPITVVNQSVGTISYTIFGGSASGSGTGSGTGSGSKGSGVLASGTIRPSGTAAATVSGHPAYTVVFGWPTFPSYQVSASGVVKIVTSAQS